MFKKMISVIKTILSTQTKGDKNSKKECGFSDKLEESTTIFIDHSNVISLLKDKVIQNKTLLHLDQIWLTLAKEYDGPVEIRVYYCNSKHCNNKRDWHAEGIKVKYINIPYNKNRSEERRTAGEKMADDMLADQSQRMVFCSNRIGFLNALMYAKNRGVQISYLKFGPALDELKTMFNGYLDGHDLLAKARILNEEDAKNIILEALNSNQQVMKTSKLASSVTFLNYSINNENWQGHGTFGNFVSALSEDIIVKSELVYLRTSSFFIEQERLRKIKEDKILQEQSSLGLAEKLAILKYPQRMLDKTTYHKTFEILSTINILPEQPYSTLIERIYKKAQASGANIGEDDIRALLMEIYRFIGKAGRYSPQVLAEKYLASLFQDSANIDTLQIVLTPEEKRKLGNLILF